MYAAVCSVVMSVLTVHVDLIYRFVVSTYEPSIQIVNLPTRTCICAVALCYTYTQFTLSAV